jgi:hypothetical protein
MVANLDDRQAAVRCLCFWDPPYPPPKIYLEICGLTRTRPKPVFGALAPDFESPLPPVGRVAVVVRS